MKKIVALLMVVILAVSLCACGNNAQVLSLHEKATTDIMKLQINSAELAFYAKSAQTSTSDGSTANIDEACAPLDSASGAYYKTNKGYTLLCLDFTLENLDRDTLEIGGSFPSVEVSFEVNQDGKSSKMRGYSLNYPEGMNSLNLEYSPMSFNGRKFMTNKTSNKIINAGSTVRIKTVGVLNFESVDLSAPFDLTVTLSNSSKRTEKFVYTIN